MYVLVTNSLNTEQEENVKNNDQIKSTLTYPFNTLHLLLQPNTFTCHSLYLWTITGWGFTDQFIITVHTFLPYKVW
jgi:hypothetical protein